jgi:hypothetical protein
MDMSLARLRSRDDCESGNGKNEGGKGKDNKVFHDAQRVAFRELTRKVFFLFFIYFFLCHSVFFC